MRLLRHLVLAVALAVAAAAAGCDLRPLRSADLYGAAGAPGHGGAGGAAGQGGAGGAAGNAGESGGGGSARGGAAGGLAGAGGQPVTDAAVDQGMPDGPPSGCAQPCSPDQFCDELTNQCAPRIGTGMLSGIVVDACFVDVPTCELHLTDGHPWVREPLVDWLGERWTGSRGYGYRVEGDDPALLSVSRL